MHNFNGCEYFYMEATNQLAAYISNLDQQPIRDHYLFWEILIQIFLRYKHKIVFRSLKGLTRLSLKSNTTTDGCHLVVNNIVVWLQV